MKKLLYGVSAVGLLLLNACRHDPEIPVSPEISFLTDVQPILAGNCNMSSCHGGGGNHEPGSLVTYDDVIHTGEIHANEAHSSKLYKLITKSSGEDKMPPDPASPLTDKQILTIYLWIEQGAKNN